MTQNVYESMFIFDSNRFARDPDGVSGKIPQMVQDCGGEMLASRLWNEQKLAYTIKGHRKGTYWLTYFRMDANKVADFNRACRLNEDILRNLTLKVDPRLVDTLVAHARGEAVPQATDDEKRAGESKGTGSGRTKAERQAVGAAAEAPATPESEVASPETTGEEGR